MAGPFLASELLRTFLAARTSAAPSQRSGTELIDTVGLDVLSLLHGARGDFQVYGLWGLGRVQRKGTFGKYLVSLLNGECVARKDEQVVPGILLDLAIPLAGNRPPRPLQF